MATAESVLPSPDKTSCLRGQPPNKTDPHPTNAIPKKFHRLSVCAIGWPSNPKLKYPKIRFVIKLNIIIEINPSKR